MSYCNMDSQNQSQSPGLFDGVKFWARLFGEVSAIFVGSIILFFIARPIWTFLTGDPGQGFTFTWFALTVFGIWWYRRRRLRIGY